MWVIIFSLIPLVGWGTSDYIASRYSKRLHPAMINLFFSLGGLMTAITVSSILGFPEITAFGLLQFIGVSVILTGGFLSMVHAYSVGATGVVSPIANSYAVLTAIISILFLHQELHAVSAVAMVTIIAGLVLLTYKKDPTHNKHDFEESVRYSVLAMLLFGVGFALFDVVSTQEWYQNFMLFEISGVIVSISLFFAWSKKGYKKSLKQAGSIPLLYLGSVIAGLGTVGLFAAIGQAENIAIPATIVAAAPLVTAYLAFIYDNEHLTGIQRFASVVVVGGIVLLSAA
jgi:drug/metabolite transporter (DMT)-like permease